MVLTLSLAQSLLLAVGVVDQMLTGLMVQEPQEVQAAVAHKEQEQKQVVLAIPHP